MKTLLIEIHVDGDKETQTKTEYPTKYEAERFATTLNQNRHYDFVDSNGKTQKLYFYTLPKKYQKA